MPYIDQNNSNDGDFEIAKELWRPTSPQSTRIHQFKSEMNQKFGLSLETYNDLWQWSINEPARFWEEVARFTEVKFHKTYDSVRPWLLPVRTRRSQVLIDPRLLCND